MAGRRPSSPPCDREARRSALSAWVLIAVLRLGAASAGPPIPLVADIPPQPLAEALAVIAPQTGLQVIYVSDITHGQQSKGVAGGLPPRVALAQLLDGTGLQFEFLNERSVRILAPKARGPPPSTGIDDYLPARRLTAHPIDSGHRTKCAHATSPSMPRS